MSKLRAVLLALALAVTALSGKPALAQGCGAQNPSCVVPTRPLGDATRSAASTLFVQQTLTAAFPWTVPQGGTGAVTFTANLPLIGNGTGTVGQGTVSGNTTKFGTVSGSLTSGNCIKSDASGNLIDAGGACGGGASGLTVGSSSIASGTNTRVLYDNSGVLGEYAISGSGNVAMTTSPTFVTPALGTPSAGVLSNATGLPIATGLTGAGTGVLTALGVNVGTAGAFVVNGGALGTPSSGLLTNATGLPLTSGVTGVLTVQNGGTGAATFTSNLPFIGNGTGAVAQGTVSGNTTKFGTVSGSLTSGNCIKSDASGNLIDAGGTCGGGASGLTVGVSTITSGTNTRVLYDNSGFLGEYTTVPLANGGSNAALTADNGGIVWSNASQLQILAHTTTANLPLLSGNAATPAWAAIAYLTSATSGGIPYFSSSTAMGSSGVMTLNGVVYGGGAAASPLSTSQGGTNTVLVANAGAPSFSATPKINTSLAVPVIGPLLDGTSALLITKADLSTSVVRVDTTNSRVGINSGAPASDLVIGGAGGVNAGMEFTVSTSIAMQAYNRNTFSYATFTIDGATILFRPLGTTGLTVSTGLTTTNGHIAATGTAPGISSCGTGSPTVTGGDNFGKIVAGGGMLTSCVLNFGAAWGAAPACTVSSPTAVASLTVTSSTSQLTIGGTSLTGDTLNYVCGSTSDAREYLPHSKFAAVDGRARELLG